MSTSSPSDHLSVLTRVIQRRGWADTETVTKIRTELGPDATANELLIKLVENNKIKKSQAKELRLDRNAPQEIADFNILSKLGTGAMGTVYLGEHKENGERAAIKVVNAKYMEDDEFINRFHQETNLLSQLKHDNIGGSKGQGNYDNKLYLALEYIDGPSLADLLQKRGPLPEEFVLKITMGIAHGLEYAYEGVGLIHRDIKPENILIHLSDPDIDASKIDMDATAKIIDFGLAKSLDNDQSLTMTGMTMGTPHYMSPEQITGKKDLDCRTDIYSLGCTMYHLLTGRTPFSGDSPGGIMMAHVNDAVPDPGDLVPGLHDQTRQTIMTAMAKDRDGRFLSYRGFINACNDAFGCIGNKGGTEKSVRLLRKPLVLPNKKKRSGSEPHVRRDESGSTPINPTTVKTPAGGNSTNPPSSAENENPFESERIPSATTSSVVEKATEAKRKSRIGSGPQDDLKGKRVISTARIKRKHQELLASGEIKVSEDARLVTDQHKPSTKEYRSAEEALRKVQTEKIVKRKTDRFGEEGPRTSAVFDDDPYEDRGTGIAPWLVLIIAIVLIFYVSFAF